MNDLIERITANTGLSSEAAAYLQMAIGFLRYCPEPEREQATKYVAMAGYQLAHPGTLNKIGIQVFEVEDHPTHDCANGDGKGGLCW